MIESLCELAELKLDQHTFKVLELKDENFEALKNILVSEFPETYLSKSSFERTMELLGQQAAYSKLKSKFPKGKKLRSGDIGEVISRTYIEKHLDYIVPIKKLQWRDHREMAMRGDDVIAIKIDGDDIKFIKCEAKSVQSLNRNTLEEARKELDQHDGKPSPHSLDFIIERLYEIGNKELAEILEVHKYHKRIRKQDVNHLLFVFTKSNPNLLQKNAFEAYTGDFCQISVGLKTKKHQELITTVFEELNNKYE
ncbi:Hachiman antiphage defense system protein HamA [Acinetobacter baumannii]|uniref:Hachiman antiphage defense system protein HamA n=1 Tax=Acinetobacter baumannii TaxID=470 RepID=UPI003B84345D